MIVALYDFPIEGVRPVRVANAIVICGLAVSLESSCLGLQLKVGGKLHPRLNITRDR